MSLHFDPSGKYPVTIDSELCVCCGLCCMICPTGAIRPDRNGVPQVTSDCIGCFMCIPECPSNAITKTF